MYNVGYNTISYPHYRVQSFGPQTNSTNAISNEYFHCDLSLKNIDCFDSKILKVLQLKKLHRLFSKDELKNIYDAINKDFGIDNPAKFKFVNNKHTGIGGGYNFFNNKIKMDLADLVDSNTKIIGIKNGKATLLISPTEKLPLFVDKKSAKSFIKKQALKGNMGYDKLVMAPVTRDEHRKFILQKITHEIIHSQQHMIMRKSDSVGSKEIIKALNKEEIKNPFLRAYYNAKIFFAYTRKALEKESKTTKNIANDEIAKKFLLAVQNYGKFGTKEYFQNVLETDANNRAAEYITRKYGAWN